MKPLTCPPSKVLQRAEELRRPGKRPRYRLIFRPVSTPYAGLVRRGTNLQSILMEAINEQKGAFAIFSHTARGSPILPGDRDMTSIDSNPRSPLRSSTPLDSRRIFANQFLLHRCPTGRNGTGWILDISILFYPVGKSSNDF